MNSGHEESAGREQRLHEILHTYLQAVDAVQAPDRQEFVRQHPEFAAELEAFFADQEKLDQLAQSMRLENPVVARPPDRATGPTAGLPDAESVTLPPGDSAPASEEPATL